VDTTSASRMVEALIHEYGKLVFHTIYGLTRDWEESQDLTQDTFHQALRGIEAASAASGERFHAKAWLLRIALNTVRMQRRRRGILRFIPFSHMEERRSTDQQGTEDEIARFGALESDDPSEWIAEQDIVQRTMAKLPEAMRVCLLLSVVGGLGPAEIASMLDMKEPAVRQRISRARKQFKELYEIESGEELFDGSQTVVSKSARADSEASVERHKGRDKPQRLALTTQPPTTWSSYA
jgi:RNA polymerase sigma-70 factor (ECF subfamily)